jgi:hypothetical protein
MKTLELQFLMLILAGWVNRKPAGRHRVPCAGQQGHLGAKPGTRTGEGSGDGWEARPAMRGSSRAVAAAALLRALRDCSRAGADKMG